MEWERRQSRFFLPGRASSAHVFGPRTERKEGGETGKKRGEVEERGVEKRSVKCGMLYVYLGK